MSNISELQDLKGTLGKPDIHRRWANSYRTSENERFFEQAFDFITGFLNAPEGSIFLDAGCGTCSHSFRLAKRGFFVMAADFSESALKTAESRIQSGGLRDRIKLHREDILSLSFGDEMFGYVLCWGVLMHIADVERAIAELARVLKKGGVLVLSEANMLSLQSLFFRAARRIMGKKMPEVKETPAGLEYWEQTSSGWLLTRQANIRWLVERFEESGFAVRKHVAGQFTELYTRVSSRLLKNLVHGFNNLWFRYVRVPYPAFGNIIILQKLL